MSLLFWAFLAGSAAVVLPLVFHLFRRSPRGEQPFSSLMFLQPSPPRLTRRSRLNDLLLLLLRALAILLLAIAFTRPFWRNTADLSLSGVRGRRVAILLDASASMRRGDLWRQALDKVEEQLDQLEPGDDAGLFLFDRDLRTIIDFDREPSQASLAAKANAIRRRLPELSPTWDRTDLGAALIHAVEHLDDVSDRKDAEVAAQLVVISDLQQGSSLSALQAYAWPKHAAVALEPVTLADNSNASVQLLSEADEEPTDDDPSRATATETVARVRVANSSDSANEQFYLRWSESETPSGGDATPCVVPPGQSRVVRLPRSSETMAANRVVLTGDPSVFDNTFYTAPWRQQEVRLAYFGAERSDDPQGLRYYLERALGESPRRKVLVAAYTGDETPPTVPGETPQLTVAASPLSEVQQAWLVRYLESGGKALVVLTGEEMAASLGELLAGAVVIESSRDRDRSADDYRMLGQIDFRHPVFSPFANPRYNDFTQVRFWRRQEVDLSAAKTARPIAHFDDGLPAFWEQPHGAGTAYLLASGWRPTDSQLARSTKFVPLLESLLKISLDRQLQNASYRVQERVPLPPGSERSIRRSDGVLVAIPAEAESFAATDAPGLYLLTVDQQEQPFAVNIAASESDTAPLDPEQLEQFGLQFKVQTTQLEEFERLRQLRDVELEGEQQLWKWLILAAMAVIGMETLLAGWRARKNAQPASDA